MGGFNASRVVVLRVSASQEIQTSDDGRFGENLQVSGTAQVAGSLTVGDGGAEDSKLLFDGNAQDYRIGVDDGTDILEIGAGTAHGSTTAIKINGSGEITQLGDQTSPTNGHFLKYDGSKIAFASVSSGGGADTGLANTFTEAQTISKDQDSELIALILKNESDAANTSGLVSLRFDLEDTGGTAVDSGKIAVKKEASFTSTAATQDSSMVFSTSLNGTLTEHATLTSAGNLGVGVTDPDAKLEVLNTSTQAKFSYDADSFATVTVADASHTTVATGESGNLILDAAGDIEINADGGNITFKDGSDVIFDIVKNSGFHTIDITGDIRLDASGGDIAFLDNGALALIFDLDHTSGESHIYSMIDEQDVVFRAAHTGGTGVEILRLTDGGQAEIKDNLSLKSDAAVLKFGASEEVSLTHVADSGLQLTHTATGDNTPVTLTLKSEEDVIIADEVLGAINFKGGDSGGTDAILVAAGIEAVATDTHAADNNATKLAFKTAASEAATEKMTLTSAGNLGVGVTDPDAKIEVLSTSTQAKFSYDGASFASITVASDGATTFATVDGDGDGNSNEADLKFDAEGDIYLTAESGQVYIERPDGNTRLRVDVSTANTFFDHIHNADIAFRLGSSPVEIARFDQSEDSLLMATDSKIQFRDTATHISSTGANVLNVTAPTLDIDASTTVTVDTATVDVNASGLVTIDSVGLSIDSAGVAANITSTTDGAAEDFTIALAGATDSSLILSSTGTAADALQISTSAGGMDITVAGAAAGEDLDISSNSSINITATEDAASAIVLHANGGTSETIKIHSDQGTSVTEGAASVQLLSDAGGIGIKSTANLANAVLITTDGGADETIVIHSDQGTGEGNANASIELLSDAGGICFTATGLTGVMTDGNSDAAIQAHAAAGGIGLRSTANLAGSIQIEADGGADETIIIHSDQGTGEDSITLTSDAGGIDINAAAGKDVTVDGGQLLLTSAHDVANSIYLRANAGTSETIKIHADQGTGAGSIELTSDAGSIDINSGDNVTIDAADEITVTTTSADGHISLVSAHTAGVALHIDANANAGSIVDIDAGILDIDVTGASTLDTTSLTVTTDTATFTSANANDPVVIIQNTNDDANGSTLKFVKDGGNVADGDVIGNIAFVSEDDGDAVHTYAQIIAKVDDMTGGAEEGSLEFHVAENDGTLTKGMDIVGLGSDGNVTVDISTHDGAAGGLKLGGTLVTSTAAELNLLDAGAITPGAGAWAAVKRIAKVIANAGSGGNMNALDLGGGPVTVDLGFDLPDNAIITGFWVDVRTAFTSDGSAVTQLSVASSTPVTLMSAQSIANFGGGGNDLSVIGVKPSAAYTYGQQSLGRTDSAGAISMLNATANLTAGLAHIYIEYVIGIN